MKVSDVILGPLVMAIGFVALYASAQQPKPFFGSAYGGGFFPTILAVGLVGGGVLLAISGWRERAGVRLIEMGNWVRSPTHIANVLVVVGALLFYIFTSNWLGFLISGFITVLAPLLQFTRAPLPSLIVSAVTILVVKVGFQEILLVPLPWGLLEPYAGVLTWR